MTTFDTVREVIARELDMPEEVITPETRIVYIADSLETAQLILELEEACGISILDDDLEKIFTVSDIVRYVEARKFWEAEHSA